MINREVFFAGVRQGPFPGKLSVSQVAGCSAILDEWERRKLAGHWELSYLLATPFHETGTAMQPVIETRQIGEKKNPSVYVAIARLERSWAAGRMPWVKKAYWRKDADGLSWLGRGLPQVTHKYNYLKAEKALGVPFTKNPDLMLDLRYAVPVMFLGMIDGWFTSKKLSDYFGPGREPDLFNARRIINGTESAAKVAGYAKMFYADIRSAS